MLKLICLLLGQSIGSVANFTIDSRCGLDENLAFDGNVDRFLFMGKEKMNGLMHLNSKYYFYDLNSKSDRRNRNNIRSILTWLRNNQNTTLTC